MRTEMLGTAYTAQHSDCRVLEQLRLGTVFYHQNDGEKADVYHYPSNLRGTKLNSRRGGGDGGKGTILRQTHRTTHTQVYMYALFSGDFMHFMPGSGRKM